MGCFSITLVSFAALVGDITQPAPPATPAQAARIQALIETLFDRDAPGTKLVGTRRSIQDLAKMGPVAAPQLIRAVAAADPATDSHGSAYASHALVDMGRPAVGPVRAAWATLNPTERWQLMKFRGEHDYAAALPFAIASLESRDSWVAANAAHYLGRHKEATARKPLIAALNTTTPDARWTVIHALASVGGEEAVDALIPLLDKASWAAEGEGQIPPCGITPPWWPDGRPEVIEALRTLKAAKAAPAMLKVLREKGEGRAFFGGYIIPFLGEYGGLECVPELRRIAASDEGEWGHAKSEARYIKAAAAKAVGRIEARNG